MFLPVFVCVQDDSKSCGRILMNFFGRVGCVNSNNWLDIGRDPDHDADPGIFEKEFFAAGLWTLLDCISVELSGALAEDCGRRVLL